ncbi:hypothetical protein ADK67_15050 [Saccharothrix sp. NRRL B-16348]|nr:hypothetical protein ADK67_15050 [Saccharothrix sp. NRRL B-16348]
MGGVAAADASPAYRGALFEVHDAGAEDVDVAVEDVGGLLDRQELLVLQSLRGATGGRVAAQLTGLVVAVVTP